MVTKKVSKNSTPASGEVEVKIPQLDKRILKLTLVGTSPLVQHRFSEKKRKQMEEKQQKTARHAKEARRPEEDYEEAKYKMPDGSPGHPAICFKAAAVNACRYVDGIAMTVARGAFFVLGDMIPLKSDPPIMRTDTVRNASGVADMRYRPQYDNWSVDLEIEYNAAVITADEIVNLLNVAGFACGTGERRPQQKAGDSFGRWRVEGA